MRAGWPKAMQPAAKPQLDLANGYYALPPGKMANVVTCLEMRARPERTLAPLPAPYCLKQFGPDDTANFRQLVRQVGEPWLWLSRMIMPEDELRARLSDPAVFMARLCDEQSLGLVELDFRETSTCEIVQFGLLPGQTGKGLGGKLMDAALALAWSRPVTRVWLHTCNNDSPQAVPFYLRCGFHAYARMVEIHDDPRLHGKLPLSAAPHIPIIGYHP